MKIRNTQTGSAFVTAMLCTATPVLAQTPGAGSGSAVSGDIEEILVTARKREETAFDTPVVLQVTGGEELERRSISNVEGISRITPLLLIGENSGGVQGAPISMRGVAGGDVNPFADQAVAFNIDGIQVARSSVQRLGMMDVAAVEVLKGPQALFFGKNSPGGVISLRTADPTSSFESKVSAGYEFNADETRIEGIVSGPVTDTLGVRVAGYFSDIKGYVDNEAVPRTGQIKSYSRAPNGHEWATRVTLKFEPNDRFNARAKFAYGKIEDLGPTAQSEIIHCGALNGLPQQGRTSDCVANLKNAQTDAGPAMEAIVPGSNGGIRFSNREQILTSLDMNYEITDDLSFTSVTGLYLYDLKHLSSIDSGDNAPAVAQALPEELEFREINQEFRFASTFEGLFNFVAGAQYQSSRSRYKNDYTLVATGRQTFNADLKQAGEAYSFFGQVILRPVEQLEVTAGGRWSHEEKRIRTFVADVEQLPANSEPSWSNFSPEVTVAWHVTPEVNLFGSFRKGFLSGGFNGAPNTNFTGRNIGYDEQTIKGGEVGVKAQLFDRRLRMNLALFDYGIKGLQVSSTTGATIVTTNAGKATTRGVEFDASWLSPVNGLTMRGAVSYNKARYDRFTFTCYRGQTIAAGCNLAQNAVTGLYALQDLAGVQIVRSPKWGGSAGFTYETQVGGFKAGASGDTNYSSSYFNNVYSSALFRQKSYWLFDASVRLASSDDKWEVALLGRNLGNKRFVVRAAEIPFSGGASGGVTATNQADIVASVSRGREVMLRFTVRPNLF